MVQLLLILNMKRYQCVKIYTQNKINWSILIINFFVDYSFRGIGSRRIESGLFDRCANNRSPQALRQKLDQIRWMRLVAEDQHARGYQGVGQQCAFIIKRHYD